MFAFISLIGAISHVSSQTFSGEIASLAEVVDFIFAAQMARQLDEFWAAPEVQEVISLSPLEHV